MKLTPIKVRGKREQSRPSVGPLDKGNWNVKRKQTADMSDEPVAKRAPKHNTKANDGLGGRLMMTKAVPRILQLPQEVLEHIFIVSKNLRLPLVNRELLRRLSTDSIRYRLVGAAFGPTWHAWYGLDNAQVLSYHGWNSDVDRIAGDAAFQSAVLACSWAKLPSLLTSFEVWIRQYARGHTYFTVPKLSEERLRNAPEPGSLYDRAYNAIDSGPSDTRRPSTMTMRQKFLFDLESFQDFIVTERMRARSAAATPGGQVYNPAHDHLRALLGMHLEVHPGAAIPSNLLSGPFESEDDGSIAIGEEKAQRLFWLVRGGACLQEDQTWEATRDGFKAILSLIKGSTDEGVSPRDGEKKLTLATQLIFLFGLLGVFASQWPKYVLQTNLGHVTALISTLPTNSMQQYELGEIACTLRAQGRANSRLERYGSHLQHYSSRWQPQVTHTIHVPHRGLQVALFSAICAGRADLFLRARTTDGREVPSDAVEDQRLIAEDATGLMHEPWSDFGMD